MKSIIDRALDGTDTGMTGGTQPPAAQLLNDDDELQRIVDTLRVKISIIGCGGGGSNTVRRLYEADVMGADLVAANTDAKHLLDIKAPNKILLGRTLTRGLGAGAIPDVGQRAAEEARDDIMRFIDGRHIVFVTAGMGGGTGTGSASYVAELAKRREALTLGVVTLPFAAEGNVRMENALQGLNRLRSVCDTTIVIPNDRLLELVPRLPIEAAFRVADEVLMQTIKGITEVITKPGLVNVDYNDILTVMQDGGVAMIGIGESEGPQGERIEEAMEEALDSPLLGDIDITQARGALIRVVGGPDMTISEAEKAASMVSERINPDARIIWGCSVEPDCEGMVKTTLVITGVRSQGLLGPEL